MAPPLTAPRPAQIAIRACAPHMRDGYKFDPGSAPEQRPMKQLPAPDG